MDAPARPARSRPAPERETASLAARLEEVEQARSRLEDFVAIVAHELVKPLSLAQSFADGLPRQNGTQLDAGARLDLEIVSAACGKARTLVEALLADARQRHAVTERRSVDVAQLVGDCLAVLAPDIERAHLRVEVGELPVVQGNAVLLWVVFRNLIGNAVEHGVGSARTVRVSAERSEDAWTFAVDSVGTPIPEHERHRMFDAVRHLGSTRQAGGAGLGLVLVRRIVEREGGRVGVTSLDGSTNRFFFTLPAHGGSQPASRIR
jgi:light-regulated signal transduction histidine kinase (bacteriophytochrome)